MLAPTTHFNPYLSTKQQLWLERTLAILPLVFAIFAVLGCFADMAHANLPWEGPLCKVANSLKGPVAKAVAIIAIVICGLLLALGEMSGIFKTMLGLLMGTSMALLAGNWLGVMDANSAGFSCPEY